ncbi:uncharacterized protein CIMG_04665 [Coccidioides immitis RS]|uniref:WD40 repeat-containing protein n=4 Tax=Coccidioides immitis TaxID=5501 RepID=A0A0E1RYZ3_COCIM|nr:uncharacterized protein CIMG_04665 [Coccidioides immitis RS]KMP04828.1 hypothetical protein CIRG_04509 [Coccidioides immitis RMSCC 2394]KMU78393.1 WD40 repeat-containing protein [Coccidioides immitis RMSCC 3703]KMU86322.1 WD40 repeat-containing protein [Coccidioides immitis H538.4]TPX21309.1 hypothetical protein DIZ76_015265 [Coccidioides immitis]EAS33641.1 hypothetical protein CIMG_04665 [Coccidioides immitis RS]
MMFLKSVLALAVASVATVQAAPVNEERAAPSPVPSPLSAAPAWQARHGLTSKKYQSTFDDLLSQGYRLTYASGYTDNDSPRYAGIWKKVSTTAWQATHGQSGAQFDKTFYKLRDQGYHPVVLNGYTVNGDDKYVSIWDKSKTGPWEARREMSQAGLQKVFNELKSKGYRMVHVSGYAVGKEARFAGIWEKRESVAWEVRVGLTSSQYQTKTEEMKAKGFRPVQVNGYAVNGKTYYAAIWEKDNSVAWQARHGLTSKRYQEEFDKLNKQGYTPTVVSGYPSGDSVRYAAIWEKK